VLTVLLTVRSPTGPPTRHGADEAKFLGQAEAGAVPRTAGATARGTLERNRINDRAFLIAGTKYERGVRSVAGEVSVILPRRRAIRGRGGVDGNDLATTRTVGGQRGGNGRGEWQDCFIAGVA